MSDGRRQTRRRRRTKDVLTEEETRGSKVTGGGRLDVVDRVEYQCRMGLVGGLDEEETLVFTSSRRR